MIKTKDLRIEVNQTVPILLTFYDYTGQPINLTGATVYVSLTADMKVPKLWTISSTAPTSNGSVTILDQVASPGQAIATILPTATSVLLPYGDSDPYFWDAWAVDATGNKYPGIATSRFVVLPPVTTGI